MKKINAKRRHPLVSNYNAMIDRCYNKANPQYTDYGGRVITVDERWLPNQPNAQGFWNFVEDMGDKPDGMTLERYDNSKGYSPNNCGWASKREQAENRRNTIYINYKGKRQTATSWAHELGLSKSVVLWRYHKGLPVEVILSPTNYRGKSL